jgi:hypothetical protein
LNYALQFGHSYSSWKSIVNTMLEKDPGNPKIHRLRVIHLYEADYNLILAVKWRQTLHHACEHNLINPSQYGSQPGKEATDALMLRELEYEMGRITRKACLHFDNDATSCYDRIPCALANIMSRKYGIHRKVCIVQGKTLEEAKYYLKTKLGVSDEFIQHCKAFPIFGTGQGSGNSPAVWLFISSTLFDIYDKLATGSTYQTRDKSMELVVKAVGFVDDVRTSTNDFANNGLTIDHLVDMATKDSQAWHDLLAICNQKLELPKCGYHAIMYEFEPSGEPLLIDQPASRLTLQDGAGDSLDIKQWATTMATKYLGAHKCPADQKKQKQVLKEKCDDFARVINSSHLNRRETRCFYHHIYRLSANYTLPTTYFTYKDLKDIQSKAHSSMVARMGYCRSTPLSVIFGPPQLGGAGFFHLYDDQGYGQVKMFMKFWRSPDTQIGKMLRITMAWAQFAVGTSIPMLEDVHRRLPHNETRWLESLREYLASVHGTIVLHQPSLVPLQRAHDSYIMDLVLADKRFKKAAIRRINYCRMYLNVLLLSDITTPCGRSIDPDAAEGYRDGMIGYTSAHCVNQPKPDGRAWKQWKKFINTLTITRYNRRLKQPLGAWLVPAHELVREWPFYLDPAEDALYRRTGLGFTRHDRIIRDFDRDPSFLPATLPPSAVPVSAILRPSTFSITTPPLLFQDAPPVLPTTIIPLLPTLDPWEQAILEGTQFLVDESDAWNTICAGNCIIATDGSAPHGKGSFAWIVSDPTGRRLVKCSGPVHGKDISSFRAESYGMLSALCFLFRMTKLYGTYQSCASHFHSLRCDNQSLVTKINKVKDYSTIYPNVTMDAEWDCIAQIRTTMKALGKLAPSISHILGHQDQKIPYEQLPLDAQLNCDADVAASQYLQMQPLLDHSHAHTFPEGHCQLILHSGSITRDHKRELQQARTSPALESRLCTKHMWDSTDFRSIDWVAHGRALRRQDKHRVSMVKYVHNLLPLGKTVNRNFPRYPASCPSCHAPVEDREHFWACSAPPRLEWRANFLEALTEKLDELKTDPQLARLLVYKMRLVLARGNTSHRMAHEHLRAVSISQSIIGWDQILKGRFSVEWARAQGQFAQRARHPTGNGCEWTTCMADFMLEQWWKLWTSRNEDRHGRDYATQLQAANRQALRELEQFYQNYSTVAPQQLHWLFGIPLPIRQQWPTYAIRQWLNTWTPTLDAFIRNARTDDESYTTALETG